MIKQLLEARKNYPQGTLLEGSGRVLGTIYIDLENRLIKSCFGYGVIYDYKTDLWAEKY